jgi:hypothetical protein
MPVSIKESILITGTGRCGTTFLVALFTLLGMDTGFTRETLKENIHDKVKGGLEERPGKYTITKNPGFMFMIESYILQDKQVPKMVIIPGENFQGIRGISLQEYRRAGTFGRTKTSGNHGVQGCWGIVEC